MQTPPSTPAAGPAPVPLVLTVRTTPFPTDVFPPSIADMIEDVATFTQVDPAMAGTSALTALAAAVCGRAEIEARPGWREPLTLMTATVARPGERKSAVQQAMTRPLIDVERDLVDTVAPARIEAETQKAVAVRAAEKAKQDAGRVEGRERTDAIADAISAAAHAEDIVVPPLPRLLADDVTPEAVASLLAEQGGRLSIVSAEGGVFDMLAGRYSALPNLDVFLKGHAGDPIRVDRRGRDPEFIDRPALTVGLMLQPSVLSAIGRQETFRGRGLLARFLYSIPTSKVGSRQIGPPTIRADVAGTYATTIRSLALELTGRVDPAVLHPDPVAAERILTIERVVEPQLRDDGDFAQLRDWGSKFTGAILRIAGLLHLADHAGDLRTGLDTPVPPETIERASVIGAYFKAQAVAAFADMLTDEATRDAVYLLDRIRAQGADQLSLRDLQRLARRFRTRAEIEAPVQRLLDNGWLIAEDVQHDGPGRPPGPTFTVHPHTWGTERTERTEGAA